MKPEDNDEKMFDAKTKSSPEAVMLMEKYEELKRNMVEIECKMKGLPMAHYPWQNTMHMGSKLTMRSEDSDEGTSNLSKHLSKSFFERSFPSKDYPGKNILKRESEEMSPSGSTAKKVDRYEIPDRFSVDAIPDTLQTIDKFSQIERISGSSKADRDKSAMTSRELFQKAEEHCFKWKYDEASDYIWLAVLLSIRVLFIDACKCDIRTAKAGIHLGRHAIHAIGLPFTEKYKYIEAIDFADNARQVNNGEVHLGEEDFKIYIPYTRKLLELFENDVNKEKVREAFRENYVDIKNSEIHKENGSVTLAEKSYTYERYASF